MAPVEVSHDGTTLRGYVARPRASRPCPAVLVMHSALGIANPVNERTAQRLAELGYLAVCTDMYGAQHEGMSVSEAGDRYAANLAAPIEQRARARLWFDHVASMDGVDPTRVAALGYCYGGKTVLELARDGADTLATVSFHGTLDTHAPAEPGAITGHVVAWCGAADPFAPLSDVDALRGELLGAGVARHQITVFGGVGHGFTDPDASRLGLDGVAYDALADQLSWDGTMALLHHVFRT